jgi:hypothetical protein
MPGLAQWRSAGLRSDDRAGSSWLCQSQGELPIGTGVALDEVPEHFRNIVPIDVAATLDFEGDIF